MTARQIGLLGGTFDPIHNAHLRLAEEAAEALALDRVLFLPAPNPWRKAGRRIAPLAHRVAMVRLALADNRRFELSTIELDQDGPTFTALTLAALRRMHPDATLHFIMGADTLRDLPFWHQPEQIVALARLAVTRRPRRRLPELELLEERVRGISAALEPFTMTPLSISSTEIRRLAAAGRSLRYLVPDAVAGYIEEHALYRA